MEERAFRREPPHPELLAGLRIDCAACCGYCCTALYFSRCDGFPADKPAGKPCGNLLPDFRCGVHSQLSRRGLKGCRAYDCLGAGQAAAAAFAQNWREHPQSADKQFAVFLHLCRLHQIRWHLLEALRLLAAQPLWDGLERLLAGNLALAGRPCAALLESGLAGHREDANLLLRQAGELAMRSVGTGKRCADGIGRRFRGTLKGMDFSMSLLLAADFSGCTLLGCSMIGADLRDSDLRGADLRGCFYLTQGQINAAKGDRTTRLPDGLCRPAHWLHAPAPKKEGSRRGSKKRSSGKSG